MRFWHAVQSLTILARHGRLLVFGGLTRWRLETFGLYMPSLPGTRPWWRINRRALQNIVRQRGAYARWVCDLDALRIKGAPGWWQSHRGSSRAGLDTYLASENAADDTDSIVLATTNRTKLERLQWLLEGLPVQALSPAASGVSRSPYVMEQRQTCEEIAIEKARAWSRAAGGRPALASDGGLLIPALGDRWHALHTRRFAGEWADDAARAKHLVALMCGLSGTDRAVQWREAVALARGDTVIALWAAQGDAGTIADRYEPSDHDNEFWTESVRIRPEIGKLYRDFTPEERDEFDSVWPVLREQVREFFGPLHMAESSHGA